MQLREMKGLGPASEKQLMAVGIETPAQLAEFGAVRAFLRLKQEAPTPPSLNFLYAMIGALEDRHWIAIAREEKGRLLMELEGYEDLRKLLEAEGQQLKF